MEKFTKHSIQWFYNLLEIGECDYLDFKEFGKSLKSYAPK
jgi:ATP-dependent DNA helicase RecG